MDKWVGRLEGGVGGRLDVEGKEGRGKRGGEERGCDVLTRISTLGLPFLFERAWGIGVLLKGAKGWEVGARARGRARGKGIGEGREWIETRDMNGARH